LTVNRSGEQIRHFWNFNIPNIPKMDNLIELPKA